MITKTQLKQEIDRLDDGYIELAYQFLHQLQRPDPMQCSRAIDYGVHDVDDQPVFTDIEDPAGYVNTLREEWQKH